MSNNLIDDMLKQQVPKQKKKGGIGIIIFFLIFLLAIAAAGFAVFMYVKNQNKVTPKDEFIQYMGKCNISNVLNFEKINNLNDRIQSETSETTTEITGDIPNSSDSDIDLSEMKLKIDSKSNPISKKFYSEVALKYQEDNDIIDFNILSSKNKIGVFSEQIVTKYLGSDYSNLSTVLNGFLGENDSQSEINFNFDSLNNTKIVLPQINNEIFAKYIDIINKSVPDTAFSSEKITLDRNSVKMDVTEYSMKLNEEQAIGLVDQILKRLQNDDELLNIILSSFENSSELKELINSQIEIYINSLYEKAPDNNKVYTVKVYGANNITYKVIIDLAGENSIDIDFDYQENKSSMTVTYLESNSQNGYSLELVKTTSDVSENLSFTINMIQNSEIVGKANITSDLVSSRKFI